MSLDPFVSSFKLLKSELNDMSGHHEGNLQSLPNSIVDLSWVANGPFF